MSEEVKDAVEDIAEHEVVEYHDRKFIGIPGEATADAIPELSTKNAESVMKWYNGLFFLFA